MTSYGSQLQKYLNLKDSMKDMDSVVAFDDALKIEQSKLEALESLVSGFFAMIAAQFSKIVALIQTLKIQNEDDGSKPLIDILIRSAWLTDSISEFSLLVCM